MSFLILISLSLLFAYVPTYACVLQQVAVEIEIILAIRISASQDQSNEVYPQLRRMLTGSGEREKCKKTGQHFANTIIQVVSSDNEGDGTFSVDGTLVYVRRLLHLAYLPLYDERTEAVRSSHPLSRFNLWSSGRRNNWIK